MADGLQAGRGRWAAVREHGQIAERGGGGDGCVAGRLLQPGSGPIDTITGLKIRGKQPAEVTDLSLGSG